MDFDTLSLFVLLGAIQGFTLCLYIYAQRKINPTAARFFLLFLFSLAFFNLVYAFIIRRVDFFAIDSLPYPYDYLIGVGFYLYIKSHISPQDGGGVSKSAYILFIPAVIYGGVEVYWYFLKVTKVNEHIIWQVYQTRFFTYNEFAYLIFNAYLLWKGLKFLNQYESKIIASKKSLKNWQWLKKFTWVFLGLTVVNLLNQVMVVAFNASDNFWFYAIILVLNSAFIYWIGFVGFTNNAFWFKEFTLKKEVKVEGQLAVLQHKLEQAIEKEAFKNPQLKVADLASQLGVSPKELSTFIAEIYQMNFSEYINYHRVEKVKKLLELPEEQKYTLVFIAEKSGFSSKSSFNAIFKKCTGLTPRQYRQEVGSKKV